MTDYKPVKPELLCVVVLRIYAIKRLPTNVTNTYVFLMCNEIPTIYLNKHIVERSVEGAARRRPCFPLGPGKNLILVRYDQRFLPFTHPHSVFFSDYEIQ
jgi:hypothetical protein